MKELGERNKILLLEGARITGSMTEAYLYANEQLYVDEAEELEEFCTWVDENVGGCGSANIDMLFKAFKNPQDASLQMEVAVLRKKIEEINAPVNEAKQARQDRQENIRTAINMLYQKLFDGDSNAGEVINTLLTEHQSETQIRATLQRIMETDDKAIKLVQNYLNKKPAKKRTPKPATRRRTGWGWGEGYEDEL